MLELDLFQPEQLYEPIFNVPLAAFHAAAVREWSLAVGLSPSPSSLLALWALKEENDAGTDGFCGEGMPLSASICSLCGSFGNTVTWPTESTSLIMISNWHSVLTLEIKTPAHLGSSEQTGWVMADIYIRPLYCRNWTKLQWPQNVYGVFLF